MNGAPAIIIERRNSFEDHSQAEIEIQDANKIHLKHSMREKPDDYYYDERQSIYSNGPNTFNPRDDLLPKYSTSTYAPSTRNAD